MKILVTGFDPFGGEPINPALEAVKKLNKKIGNAEVITLEIPTVFNKSLEKIEEAIKEHNPDVVVSIGQAGGRFGITPDRVAINIDDARIQDNEGNQPVDTSVFAVGENAYFTNLPVKAMVAEMVKAGLPASLSNTAGTFVCNHVMYGVLYMINKKYPHMRGGFIHVPYITQQVATKANTPSMSIEDITRGLEICIKVISETKDDIKVAAGTSC